MKSTKVFVKMSTLSVDGGVVLVTPRYFYNFSGTFQNANKIFWVLFHNTFGLDESSKKFHLIRRGRSILSECGRNRCSDATFYQEQVILLQNIFEYKHPVVITNIA